MQRKHTVSRRSIYHKVVFFKSVWTISIVWLQNEHLHFTDNRPASAMFIHKRKNNNNIMNEVYHQKCIIENWRHFKEAGSDGWRETAAIKLDSWKIHICNRQLPTIKTKLMCLWLKYTLTHKHMVSRWSIKANQMPSFGDNLFFLFETKGPADWMNMQ